jgi:uncharacterized membrane protein YphA (DoxX/SURF4 family)
VNTKRERRHEMSLADVALLVLRLGLGGMLVAHGAK